MEQIHSYKELIVWQKAMQLVVEVYKLTELFPKSEVYSLTSQMRRSSVSIPSNIAEGRRRGSRRELQPFFLIAYGSGAELETQTEVSKRLEWCDISAYLKIESLLLEVMKMLNKMLSNLKS